MVIFGLESFAVGFREGMAGEEGLRIRMGSLISLMGG